MELLKLNEDVKKTVNEKVDSDQSEINKTVDLEGRKLAIEERKLEIELEKLKVERSKARASSISIIVSILIAAGTILISIYSQYQQAQLQFAIQEQQARSQFELKAAEVVLDSKSPSETLNRAKALQELFPTRLPSGFATSFEPTLFESKDPALYDKKRRYQDSDRKIPTYGTPFPK